ncbi:putative mrna decapping hydrolase protein [Botrytis fragariae]|uniref:Putative mrna decapping hydrolase protein n=1 Tax=Botrytis fragariae TaxID=1964551 RepID=A0A8H6EHQ4_9HELO|nr:putative mrna decapping hydrolase protein [Botrytis fragariae]KAF5872613.1 putative mrna decapping hydrolase protein [Botrytis fragariae]
MAEEAPTPTSLIRDFKFVRLLNQDQAGRRSVLCGQINSKPCLLILERAPFPTSSDYLSSLPTTVQSLENLGANDVYFWYLANAGPSQTTEPTDLKINLIYPCTEQHIKKYSKQGLRMITETPQIYSEKIRPYMQAKRDGGRLNWVYNIIDGKTEVEDVIYRTPQGRDGDEGFLLLPDLNWDRKTMEGLHLLGLVERRDIWSLRDLKKKHVQWLRHMRQKFVEATVNSYKGLEEDQLKLYVHYQPTYYHFHVHIVHVALEAGATQATGKAIGLESIIEQLENMEGNEETGMDKVSLNYTVGEASELWTDIFEPIKTGGTASLRQE